MKEKPILFSTPMVKAILEGRKTQTRRVMKPQPESNVHHLDCWNKEKGEWTKTSRSGKVMIFPNPNIIKCPWQVGQELWVRETHYLYGFWSKDGISKTGKQKLTFNRVTNGIWYADNPPKTVLKKQYDKVGCYKRPSIFMPRWASRIQLLIKDIRVERVQDITPSDCEEEGITGSTHGSPVRGLPYELYKCGDFEGSYPKTVFQELWDSINANRKDKDGNILPYSWKCNPYVWALDFESIPQL